MEDRLMSLGEPPFFEHEPSVALEKVLAEPVTLDPDMNVNPLCRQFVDTCCLCFDASARWTASALLKVFNLLG
jgi:hypothetical protein